MTRDFFGSVHRTIEGWASRERRLWQANGGVLPFVMAETSPSIFVLKLTSSGTELEPKTTAAVYSERARMYVDFLGSVAAKFGIEATIAIDTADGCSPRSDGAVFSFQKTAGSTVMLLPDIDFLGNDFYRDASFVDETSFAEKRQSAAFAGSTTGAGTITLEALAGADIPRIRLARFARGRNDMDVRLPNLTQYQDLDVARAMVAEGLGGPFVSWTEQYCHRYLISMDGNGATCSRLYLALASNCCPIRYASPFALHYTAALIDGAHYIGVTADEEISAAMISFERGDRISAAGKEFAGTFLSRDALELYTYFLLRSG